MANEKYRNRDWLTQHTLFVGLITFGLVMLGFTQLDQTIAFLFSQPEYASFSSFSREVTNVGYSIHYFILALTLFVAAKFFDKKIKYLRDKPQLKLAIEHWSVFVFKCLIVVGLAVQVLKILFGRQRPHTTESFENLAFDPFNFHWHWHSFPSGHTQVMFTMATIGYLIWPKFRTVFFFLATFFAFTRVIILQHFFSDFVFGAFIGYILALWIYYKWPPKYVLK